MRSLLLEQDLEYFDSDQESVIYVPEAKRNGSGLATSAMESVMLNRRPRKHPLTIWHPKAHTGSLSLARHSVNTHRIVGAEHFGDL